MVCREASHDRSPFRVCGSRRSKYYEALQMTCDDLSQNVKLEGNSVGNNDVSVDRSIRLCTKGFRDMVLCKFIQWKDILHW